MLRREIENGVVRRWKVVRRQEKIRWEERGMGGWGGGGGKGVGTKERHSG